MQGQTTKNDVVAGNAPGGSTRPGKQRGLDFPCEFRPHAFVGIDEEHMVCFVTEQIECVIALIGIVPEAALYDTCAGVPGEFGRSVCAEGIQHQHLVGETQTVEALPNVACFVERENNRHEALSLLHRGPPPDRNSPIRVL